MTNSTALPIHTHTAGTDSPSKLEAGEIFIERKDIAPTMASRLADPAPLAMGGFATSIITLALIMLNSRGVQVGTINFGNLCFVACFGLLISAQWEMVRGNTFAYTVLGAFALLYGGYGLMLLPSIGIMEAYGGAESPQYLNAMGLYILMWGIFNTFFLITSTAYTLVHVALFAGLEGLFLLDAAGNFVLANGNHQVGTSLVQAAGVFGLIAGLAGYYACAVGLCQEALPFQMPMGVLQKRGKRHLH